MSKTIHGAVAMIDARTVAGYVHDTTKPRRKLVIEISADDVVVAAVRAADYSPALAASGCDDPYHGFIHTLAADLAATSRVISVRLANLTTPVGKPIDLASLPKPDPMAASAGAVDRVDGLAVTGWVKGAPGTATFLKATAAGEEIAATIARTWTSRSIGGEERPVLAFELALPAALADGERHVVAISTSTGVPLSGSPLTIGPLSRQTR